MHIWARAWLVNFRLELTPLNSSVKTDSAEYDQFSITTVSTEYSQILFGTYSIEYD